MQRATTRLRSLLEGDGLLYLPAVYYPLAGRLMARLGFRAVYCGGYVTGGALAVSEPLLTMHEQLDLAGRIARAVDVPLLCDAGAGFGEPLHTMRTVREAIHAGVAGVHIEDQLYPKRAHYHRYVAHAIPAEDFAAKIELACRQRDEMDGDFVVIARSDTCRTHGLDEAIARVNMAAEAGADLGLVFPRDDGEAAAAPGRARIPLVYVQSRGNRDGRPLYGTKQLEAMGYKACIDAQLYLLVSLHAARRAFGEVRADGDFTGLTHEECVDLRQEVEDLIGLDEFYRIEERTVERGAPEGG